MPQSSSGRKSQRLKHSVKTSAKFPISKLPSENSIFQHQQAFQGSSSVQFRQLNNSLFILQHNHESIPPLEYFCHFCGLCKALQIKITTITFKAVRCGNYIHGQQMKNHYTRLADLPMLFMSHYTPPRIENNWLVRSFHHMIHSDYSQHN